MILIEKTQRDISFFYSNFLFSMRAKYLTHNYCRLVYLSSRNFFFASFLIFFSSSLLFAQRYPDSGVDTLLTKGIDYIIKEDYKSAEKNFRVLKDHYPLLPFGNIYLAALEIAKSYDFDEEFDDGLISSYLNAGLQKAEALLDKDPRNIWNIYSLALIKGYTAYYKALTKKWLPAISNGYDSYSYFQKCIQMDSAFYDAYTAIGNFKYWKNSLTGFLSWLPIISNEKNDGIKYLLKAINNLSYNYYLAVYSLQWIYIDEENYNDAVKISQTALQKYPGSRFFKWGLARAYEEVDTREAINIYTEILKSYSASGKLGSFHEILLKHLIAQQFVKLGENDKALQLCNEILSKNFSLQGDPKIKKRIERVNELKSQILSGRKENQQ